MVTSICDRGCEWKLKHEIKKILVAVAGYTDQRTGKRDKVLETVMERNIQYACSLGKHMKSRITLIHVIALPTGLEYGFKVELDAMFENEGRKVLEDAVKIAKDTGVNPRTILERSYGNVAHKIISAAEDGKFDLITISSRGHSLLSSIILGSVCDAVTRHATCPVLVVR
jgi:nucleotide-binding universal stress UspA family protein